MMTPSEEAEWLAQELADLGRHRVAELPLGGVVVHVDEATLDRTRRVNIAGTKEWKLKKKAEGAVGNAQAWKAKIAEIAVASKPEDIALGLHTGNSHRASLATALRGEPRRDFGSSGYAPDRGGRLAGRVPRTGVRQARPAQAEPVKMPPPVELSVYSPQDPRSCESYYVGLNSSVRDSKANATPARQGGGARAGRGDQKAMEAPVRTSPTRSRECRLNHSTGPIAMPGRDRNNSRKIDPKVLLADQFISIHQAVVRPYGASSSAAPVKVAKGTENTNSAKNVKPATYNPQPQKKVKSKFTTLFRWDDDQTSGQATETQKAPVKVPVVEAIDLLSIENFNEDQGVRAIKAMTPSYLVDLAGLDMSEPTSQIKTSRAMAIKNLVHQIPRLGVPTANATESSPPSAPKAATAVVVSPHKASSVKGIAPIRSVHADQVQANRKVKPDQVSSGGSNAKAPNAMMRSRWATDTEITIGSNRSRAAAETHYPEQARPTPTMAVITGVKETGIMVRNESIQQDVALVQGLGLQANEELDLIRRRMRSLAAISKVQQFKSQWQ